MRLANIAALALLAGAPVGAQDLSTATPIAGSWSYAQAVDGSEAVFANSARSPQLVLHCTRATRRITMSMPATAAAPSLKVWTSSLERSVPASFNPATGRLTIELSNYDPLLDAIVSSRGRFGVTIGVLPPLVIPPWAEPARVIEDCRA